MHKETKKYTYLHAQNIMFANVHVLYYANEWPTLQYIIDIDSFRMLRSKYCTLHTKKIVISETPQFRKTQNVSYKLKWIMKSRSAYFSRKWAAEVLVLKYIVKCFALLKRSTYCLLKGNKFILHELIGFKHICVINQTRNKHVAYPD